jgi:alpha-beta hydrolase superfamily lysophospholipase
VTCLARISFIGHSLGGLIIRAALPHLEEYKDKFYTYISLSSPHLGYMYNSNTLFNAGMWFLKKWRKSVSLT